MPTQQASVSTSGPFHEGAASQPTLLETPAGWMVPPSGMPGGVVAAPPGPPGVTPGGWMPSPSGASGGPGAWMPPQSGAMSAPGAPGWAPGASQPWQQPPAGSAPGGSQPWQGRPGMPPVPGFPPIMPPKGKTSGKVIAAIVGGFLAVVILVVAGVGLLYALTRPDPVITVTSQTYHGSTPSGSPEQVFHVEGRKFSHRSTITFLLDGQPAPDVDTGRSDGAGNISADLRITDDWLAGKHRLAARDADGYTTKNPVLVEIVPAPVISVISEYLSGSMYAGSTGTTFEVSGKRFALNASVTFLLDGQPVPGSQPVQSDERGRVLATLSVTTGWSLGKHILTAKDSQGYSTQSGQPLVIVHQGEAGTPGPHGAPANNASFGVNVSGSARATDGSSYSFTIFLIVVGRPDPSGGTVCAARDDGQPHTYTGKLRGTNEDYEETFTFTCSGSYKDGHLTYTETATSDTLTLSDGTVCTSTHSFVFERLDGTFTSQNEISGSYQSDYFQAPCNRKYPYIYRDPATGTWTGSVS